MIIAFSGCADSGKTTLISSVSKFFPQASIKGDDNFFLISIFKRIFGDGPTRQYNIKPKSNWISFCYPLAVYFEYWLDFILYEIIFPTQVLFKDRYIYDYLITLHCNLGIRSKIIDFLFSHFPHPSLLFYIQITSQTALSRNKNIYPGSKAIRPAFQQQVIAEYNKLLPSRSIVITNNAHLEKSISLVLEYCNFRNNIRSYRCISFSGIDGVGKSTLINLFTKNLSSINIRHRTIHFYHDTLLYKFLKLLGFYNHPTPTDPQEIIRQAQRRKLRGKSFFWALASYADGLIQYYLSRLLFPHSLLIFDRYFYDYLVTFDYYHISHVRLFTRLIPPTDLSIVLTCPPKVIQKRKLENLPEFYEHGHFQFLELSKTYGLIPLNTEKYSPEGLITLLRRHINGLSKNPH